MHYFYNGLILQYDIILLPDILQQFRKLEKSMIHLNRPGCLWSYSAESWPKTPFILFGKVNVRIAISCVLQIDPMNSMRVFKLKQEVIYM